MMRAERPRAETALAQKAALYFGLLNLVIGIAGFLGILITGNSDGFINTHAGNLLGFLGMNWLHASIHLATGVLGVLAQRTFGLAMGYWWLVAAGFAFVAAAGWAGVGTGSDTDVVLSIGLDVEDNLIHTLWAIIGLFFALRPGVAPEPAPA